MPRSDPNPPVAVGTTTRDDRGQAAQGPMIEPVAVEGRAASPSSPALSSAPSSPPSEDDPGAAAALGRRTLSTAFVMIGPDGQLTVQLRDGRMVVLRDVAMGPKDYCGILVSGGPSGTRYCGRYADVAAARPGGGPATAAPNPTSARLPMPARDDSPR